MQCYIIVILILDLMKMFNLEQLQVLLIKVALKILKCNVKFRISKLCRLRF